jgi:hypothetical protein
MADCVACETVLQIRDCANCWQSTDVRISEDAGRYLCDFIYYSSMAHLTKKQEKRRVVFLHVPVDSNTEAIKTGDLYFSILSGDDGYLITTYDSVAYLLMEMSQEMDFLNIFLGANNT